MAAATSASTPLGPGPAATITGPATPSQPARSCATAVARVLPLPHDGQQRLVGDVPLQGGEPLHEGALLAQRPVVEIDSSCVAVDPIHVLAVSIHAAAACLSPPELRPRRGPP
ncbi:hypothetical protein ACP70R_017248 [Stipagrostis hirtigluma subsp. patula]